MKDRRLLFHVHGRKFYLAPPRRPGGPYYIRFEPPSNAGKRVRTVHRSLRTNVAAAAKARAKLIIEPILNGQWETAEKLKSKSGYATLGAIIERYQLNAEDRPATIRNNISALRMLVRTVHRGDPDVCSSAILTGELIRHSRGSESLTRKRTSSPPRPCINPKLCRSSTIPHRTAKNAVLRKH